MPYLADFILSFVPASHIPAHLTSYLPGKSPLSTWSVVTNIVVTYLVVVFGACETLKGKPAFKLTALVQAHSLMLSVGSLVLMVLIGEEVFSNWLKPEIGTYGSLCASQAYTKRLEFYLTLNYYFKYYELLDTVLLALRKKHLSFLHVYHHASAVVLTFVQLNERGTVCWLPAFLNLGCHVLMYYYYYATAGGAKLWWKQYLTIIQIAQLSAILVAAYFVSYQHAAYNWFPRYLPHIGNCALTPTASIIGIGIVSSHLLLFFNFFYKTYLRKAGGPDDLVAWMRLAIQSHSKQSTVGAKQPAVQ